MHPSSIMPKIKDPEGALTLGHRYIHHHPYPTTHPFAAPVNHRQPIRDSIVPIPRGPNLFPWANARPTHDGDTKCRRTCCCVCMPDAAGLAARKLFPREFCMLNEKEDFWEVAPLLGESEVNMGAILDCGEGDVVFCGRSRVRFTLRDDPTDDPCRMYSSGLSHTNKHG